MLVEEIMIQDVITLAPTDTIAEALHLLDTYKIRHIPIVNHVNHIVGIISDRDIRDASPSILDPSSQSTELSEPIYRIMKKNVITAHPLDFVEDIANVFYENQIGCIPVTQENRLIGVVTERDLLRSFIQLTGSHKPGSHIEVKVKNQAGVLSDVTAIFGQHRTNILSVLVYPDKDDRYKVLVFRVQTFNPLSILNDLRDHGYEVIWPKSLENTL